jgi:tetratricopeptide (TPR) repeat protein
MSQNDPAKALALFTEITQQPEDEEYKLKALFEIGKCYFSLKQYDNCLKCYMSLAQKYPKHPEMKEALFFIGQSYEKKGDPKKAVDIYKRVIHLTPESDPLHSTVMRSIRNLEKG